jgi:hypothetical protein
MPDMDLISQLHAAGQRIVIAERRAEAAEAKVAKLEDRIQEYRNVVEQRDEAIAALEAGIGKNVEVTRLDTKWIGIGLVGTLAIFFLSFFIWRALGKHDSVTASAAFLLGGWITYSVFRCLWPTDAN